jgi:hypothetical protein
MTYPQYDVVELMEFVFVYSNDKNVLASHFS